MSVRAVIFDMGNVLIDWDPDRVYRQYLPDDQERAHFFAGLFRRMHNAAHDSHRPMSKALQPLKQAEPDMVPLIEIFEQDWHGFLHGPLSESVALVDALAARDVPLFGLTNWLHQTWPPQPGRLGHDYGFLRHFTDIVVSGTEGMRKPNEDIYLLALARFGLLPEEAVFVDDLAENVEAAQRLGLVGVQFQGAAHLQKSLTAFGLLAPV